MIYKGIIRFLSLVLFTLIITSYGDVVLAAKNILSMGGIAGNIHSGASILARIMWAACIIVGIALFFTAFIQYKIHRHNPKLVPLTTPVMYIILALLSLAIPFAEDIFNFEDTPEEINQIEVIPDYIDIDR